VNVAALVTGVVLVESDHLGHHQLLVVVDPVVALVILHRPLQLDVEVVVVEPLVATLAAVGVLRIAVVGLGVVGA